MLVDVVLNRHAILYMGKPIDLNDIAYVNKLLGWAISCAKTSLFLLIMKRTLTVSHGVIILMNTKHFVTKVTKNSCTPSLGI